MPRQQAPRTSSFEIHLLGLPVRITCGEDELRARLAMAYGGSLHEAQAVRIEASLEGCNGGFTIEVEGREAVHESESIAAVRCLHHELLHAVMRAKPELFYIHAAVCAFDGRGIVIPGLSQAGKSTLVLAALERGAAYLSDELLAFDPRLGRALAFPRAPKVRDVCVDYFPDLAPHFVGSGEGRYLPFTALPGAGVVEAVRIAAIVSPTWSAEGPLRLESVSPGTALLDLAASALNFGTHREQSLEHLGGLLAGADAWRLTWTEPHAAIDTLLRELAGEREA